MCGSHKRNLAASIVEAQRTVGIRDFIVQISQI
jgi:hypothetical protein